VIFAVNKYAIPGQVAAMGTNAQAFTVASPVVASIIVFILLGFIKPENTAVSDAIVDSLNVDTDEVVPVREFKAVS